MKQREIKFRARWRDTLEKVIDFNDEYTILACEDNAFIVEQYTGIKDKNGVEIYEGDIVKCPVALNKHIHGEFSNRVVKWKDDSFTWVFDSPFSWGRFEDMMTGDATDSGYFKYTDEGVEVLIEVIGNIHEHKHLLK